MKFWEAMKALQEGNKVRRVDWHPWYWISRNSCNCGGTDFQRYYMIDTTNSTEWELYEEPEPLLTFAQVIEGLKEGKRFIRKAWNNDERKEKPIHMVHKKYYIWDSEQLKAGFTIEDFDATDWVEVK